MLGKIFIGIFLVCLVILIGYWSTGVFSKSKVKKISNLPEKQITVRELINILNEYNPEAVVMIELKDYFWDSEYLISAVQNEEKNKVYLANF